MRSVSRNQPMLDVPARARRRTRNTRAPLGRASRGGSHGFRCELPNRKLPTTLRRSRRGFVGLLLAASAAWTACGRDATGPPDPGPPEDLGTPVTAANVVTEQSPLVWSRDGTEVYFRAATPDLDGADLKAVRVADGAIRTISAGLHRHMTFYLSPDGEWIYRIRSAGGESGDRSILDRVRVTGGAAEMIAENVTMSSFSATSKPPISPDGTRLAYAALGPRGVSAGSGTRDTLYLYDLTTGTKVRRAFGVPLAFSPDGTRLAYDERPCDETGRWSNPCDTYVMELSTGATQHVPSDTWDIGKQVWWDAEGLKALATTHRYDTASSFSQWIVTNLSTGTVTIAYSLNSETESQAPGWFTHSPDGTRVAGWIWYPVEFYEGLRVVDLRTLRSQLVVVNRSGEGWSPVFSPDARRIAYLVDRRLYVQQLPDAY
jgi:dipeptidyl aminopeptidase/acylaminoacyl peptidase